MTTRRPPPAYNARVPSSGSATNASRGAPAMHGNVNDLRPPSSTTHPVGNPMPLPALPSLRRGERPAGRFHTGQTPGSSLPGAPQSLFASTRSTPVSRPHSRPVSRPVSRPTSRPASRGSSPPPPARAPLPSARTPDVYASPVQQEQGFQPPPPMFPSSRLPPRPGGFVDEHETDKPESALARRRAALAATSTTMTPNAYTGSATATTGSSMSSTFASRRAAILARTAASLPVTPPNERTDLSDDPTRRPPGYAGRQDADRPRDLDDKPADRLNFDEHAEQEDDDDAATENSDVTSSSLMTSESSATIKPVLPSLGGASTRTKLNTPTGGVSALRRFRERERERERERHDQPSWEERRRPGFRSSISSLRQSRAVLMQAARPMDEGPSFAQQQPQNQFYPAGSGDAGGFHSGSTPVSHSTSSFGGRFSEHDNSGPGMAPGSTTLSSSSTSTARRALEASVRNLERSLQSPLDAWRTRSAYISPSSSSNDLAGLARQQQAPMQSEPRVHWGGVEPTTTTTSQFQGGHQPQGYNMRSGRRYGGFTSRADGGGTATEHSRFGSRSVLQAVTAPGRKTAPASPPPERAEDRDLSAAELWEMRKAELSRSRR